MKEIIILEGGLNEEHQVSLNTSKEVQKSLNRLNYKFYTILVDPKKFEDQIKNINSDNIVFFNALHGPYGEDGNIQKILENNNFKFTHSNSLSSNLSFDKFLTKSKIEKLDIPLLNAVKIKKNEVKIDKFLSVYKDFNSFVMKPVCSGSSYGVKFFNSIEKIENFFQNFSTEMEAYKNHEDILLEKFIQGRELTVAVCNISNHLHSLAVTEIISQNSFYDYEAKYVKGMSEHILPAIIPDKIYKDCLNFSKLIHTELGCKGISRSDFIYDNNKIYFLEINTQPGLTKTSLVPEQLKYKNISFDEFIKNIIYLA